jgi:uncharacterized protein YecT (DUF1311 family)
MKNIIPVALVATFSAFSALADGCMDTAVSQGQMNGCATTSYQQADKKLNDAYRNATTRVGADAEVK